MRSSENTDGLKVKATPGELEKIVPWQRIASNHTAQRPLFNQSETAQAQTGEVPLYLLNELSISYSLFLY